MRTLLAIALVLAAACGRADSRDERDAHDAPSAPRSRTPDALVLRVPRTGGTARVVAYPKMDSVVWSSPEAVSSIDRVLAFDEDAGVIAALDAKRRPVRIDLRAGTVSRLASEPLASPASADADAIFGIEPSGTVVRLTPAGRWSFKPPREAVGAFPQSDGSLLVLADHDDGSVVWRVRPPESRIVDSVTMPMVERSLPSPGSDRLYFAGSRGLLALRARTLELRTIEVADSLRDLVTTPSGDRVFLLGGKRRDRVTVVDRYRDRVEREITLPAPGLALRMDPLGRYLLVGSGTRDSVWIIAIGTGKVLGSARTTWRNDLPLVAVDGSVGLVQGPDVSWVDGETLRPVSTIAGGAADFWFAFRWNGFRPRDPALDQPVTFGGGTQTATAVTDSTSPPVDTATRRDTATASVPAAGWTVSYAALLSEERARELATSIQAAGQPVRVVTQNRDGTTVYRVVSGPFPTRDDAERAARESRQSSYWIYEGAP